MIAHPEPRCGGDHGRDDYGASGQTLQSVVGRANGEARPLRPVCSDGVSLPGKLGIAAGTVLIHLRDEQVIASEIFKGV